MQRQRFALVFAPYSGLAANEEYTLVVNLAVASGVVAGDPLLDIWAMDDVEERAYEAIEKGTARLAEPLMPQSTSGTADPMFNFLPICQSIRVNKLEFGMHEQTDFFDL